MLKNLKKEFKENKLTQVFFVVIIVVLVFNTFNYYHELGYDGQHHKYNMEVLPLNLPTEEDTKEFFNPPLPYLVPSVADKICDKLIAPNINNFNCSNFYGNVGQLLQSLIFILLLYCLLRISELIEPGNKNYKNSLLLLFLLPAVNYKTVVMIRGEIYVSLFIFACIFHFLSILKREEITDRDLLINSLLLGFIGLSKQWGLLFFPALGTMSLIVFFYKDKNFSMKYLIYSAKSFLYSMFIFGWFYLYLFTNYGSITAFNRLPSKFSFTNQPSSFYFDLALQDLFSRPIRGFSLTNKLFPILHADTWGDYWGYFLVTLGKGGRENFDIVPYLGRVNLIALIPTFILLGGLIYSVVTLRKKSDIGQIFYILISLTVSFMWIGYLWFLIKYPNLEKGDTIKGTYIISLINLLPFFGANLLEKIRSINEKIYNYIFYLLLIIFLHNLPTYITRFSGIYT
tara:strand:+ start:4097 stop:5464 length:1368 start_codon:yes stop_codon:yes gene_type:complete